MISPTKTAPGFTLQADLANYLEPDKRLTARVRRLGTHLSQAPEEAAWATSGLGASPDIDRLQRRISTSGSSSAASPLLEEGLAQTLGQMEERTEDSKRPGQPTGN
ncbi:hypothetical protein SHL15_9157 [Streptomyces hygroscopicus subsp. limoneus]|nr:hypothetical protein SHL15_9157 [Streptomyces hygroscopicus subsp. limoneus]